MTGSWHVGTTEQHCFVAAIEKQVFSSVAQKTVL